MENPRYWFNEQHRQLLREHRPINEHEKGYFVYDLDGLAQHINQLQQQDVVKLWYAVKANPLSAVIQTLAEQNMCFDVASTGELEQVLKQGVSAGNILNTGPAKSKAQLAQFLTQGVDTFVAESVNQLQRLQELATEQQCRPKVLLRVQLSWPEGEKNPLGGNQVTPFGLSSDIWRSINLSDYPALDICGLHIFQWGNILSNQQMLSLWQQMIAPLTELAQAIGLKFDILDLGGGLGIDYLEQDEQFCWSQGIEDLAQIKCAAGVKELWLELGRFAVAKCGYYVTSIVDKKTNFGQNQLVLAAGINHLLRPGITQQPFPVQPLIQNEDCLGEFHVYGPLCTSMDKLGSFQLNQDIAIGEQLVFGYCGAYGFTESMPYFLCHEIAAEYVIESAKMVEIRPAKSAASYLV